MRPRTKLFMDELDIDEMMAQLLVAEEFTALEEVAYVELDELLAIDGFDEETAEELQTRARERLEAVAAAALANAPRIGCRRQPDRIRRPDPADGRGLGERRHQDAGRFCHLRLTGNWRVAGPPSMASV